MNRDAFLARVRSAAAAGRAYRVHHNPETSTQAGYCGAGPDKVARMAAEVDTVGGRSHVVADLVEARAVLATLVDLYGPRSALCWQHPLLDRLGLAEFLASRQITKLDHAGLSKRDQPEQRALMFAADIGISSATRAVAETGTLVMASAPGRERLASLLPPVHVAIIEADQIVPDLFDLFREWVATGAENMASNVAFITGPSKTGDLELKLTTGVHGPGKWHVIVVRETSA